MKRSRTSNEVDARELGAFESVVPNRRDLGRDHERAPKVGGREGAVPDLHERDRLREDVLGLAGRLTIELHLASQPVGSGLLSDFRPMSRLSEPARVPAPAGRRKGLAAFDASSLWGYHVSVPAAFGLLPARHLASMELTNCCSMKEEVSIETRVSSGASWHQQQLLFCTRHG